jgi:hypothetical protein
MLQKDEIESTLVAASFIIIPLLLIAIFFAAAYHGTLYVTGSQFYEACSERQAKARPLGALEKPQASNPEQAALWTQCTPITARTMRDTGMFFSSSAENAPPEMKALIGYCPDRYADVPAFLKNLYIMAINSIEMVGGPSLIDRVAPAEWLIERVVRQRWPRCEDAARTYWAKRQKPAGGGADPLTEPAMPSDAPRDTLIQRLRQNGIDPTGLQTITAA